MRKVLLSIISAIAEALILYAIWGFVLWNLNASEWGEGSRVLLAYIWFAVASLSVLGIIISNKK